MSKHKINIHGDINVEAYTEFDKELTSLEELGYDAVIEIVSDGGDAEVALAFYDRIVYSPVDTITVVSGCAHSAASLIFAAGDRRIVMPNAWVMVHEETPPSFKDMTVSEIEKSIAHYRRLENQWVKLFSERTNLTVEECQKLHKEETYLSADDCVKIGLAHAKGIE